jgi:hypothetical protein
MRMFIQPRLLRIVVAGSLLVCAFILIRPTGANALVTPVVPEPSDFSADTWLQVSKRGRNANGGTIRLEAPIIWLRVYSPNPTINVTLADPRFCGSNDWGSPVATRFEAFRTSTNENLASPIVRAGGLNYDTGGTAGPCGEWRSHTITGLTASSLAEHAGLYTALIRVTHRGPNPSCGPDYLNCNGTGDVNNAGRINRFKIFTGTPGAMIGYWDQAQIEGVGYVNNPFNATDPRTSPYSAFGIGAAFALQAPSADGTRMDIEFGPPCSLTTPRTAYLKWFDADQGESNQVGDITFELYENGSRILTHRPVGGDNTYESLGFTVRPDRNYRWRWLNVDSANGIQFWMPFDDINANPGFNCPPSDTPAIGDFGASCVVGSPGTIRLRSWAYDPDRSARSVQVEFWLGPKGSPGSTRINNRTYVADQAPPADPLNVPPPYPGGNHYFTINQSGFDPARIYTIHVYIVTGYDSAGGPRTYNLETSGSPRTVGPCNGSAPTLDCSVSPNRIEVGVPQVLNISVSYASPTGSEPPLVGPMRVQIAGLGIAYNQTYISTSTPTSLTHTTASLVSNAAGQIPITVTLNGVLVTPACSLTSITKPYIKAYGGDVLAGITACPDWGADTTSGIYGFLNTPDRGSSAQLGVLATGNIDDIGSAMSRGVAPLPAEGLYIGNDGTNFGQFGGPRCPTDYAGYAASGAVDLPAMPANIGTLESGRYRYTGSYPAVIAGNISPGKKIYIYAAGSISVNGITYVGLATSQADIPFFRITTSGNINIDSGIAQIDGHYVAQGATATIDTCGGLSATDLFANCNSQLRINGSLTAKAIKWRRSNGTLNNATAGELIGSPNFSEAVYFTPEMYIFEPIPAGSATSSIKTDSIISLPPIL